MFMCNRCGGCHGLQGEDCPAYPRMLPSSGIPLRPSSQDDMANFRNLYEKQEEKRMNLHPGKRYLLKQKLRGPETHLMEIQVYELAADAIKYSSAPGGFDRWVLLKYLEDNYTVYAELPEHPSERVG